MTGGKDHSQNQGNPARKQGRGQPILFGVAVAIMLLITIVLWTGNELETPALGQVAWIAVVLALAVLFIERRLYRFKQHRGQRTTDDLQRRIDELRTRLDTATQATITSMDDEAARMVREAVGPQNGSNHAHSFTDLVISYISTTLDTATRRGVAHVLIEELANAANTTPGQPGRLGPRQLDRIRSIAHDLARDAPDLSADILTALDEYESASLRPDRSPDAPSAPTR